MTIISLSLWLRENTGHLSQIPGHEIIQTPGNIVFLIFYDIKGVSYTTEIQEMFDHKYHLLDLTMSWAISMLSSLLSMHACALKIKDSRRFLLVMA